MSNVKNKSDSDWKQQLTPDEYKVLREKGTESPFTGKFYKHFENGMYLCGACGQELFSSNTKFDSDCGWPSFDRSIEGNIILKDDFSHGMFRKEVLCSNCGSHLGHLFDDGPKETTGKRFCINSVALKFKSNKKDNTKNIIT